MAGAAEVNLLDELGRITDASVIGLTTYTFDPIFFDNVVLEKLTSNNPGAQIVVFVDARQLTSVQDAFTEETGRSYLLIAIPSLGAFHPKLAVGIGNAGGHLLAGSHNLTLAGMASNFEFTLSITDPALVADAGTYLHRLLGAQLGTEAGGDLVDQWKREVEELPTEGESDAVFLHNLERPLLPQVTELIGEDEVEGVTVLSPYHGSLSKITTALAEDPGISQVEYLLRPGEHTIDVLPSVDGVDSVARLVKTPERRLHAKVSMFTGDPPTVVFGSPNWTGRALLQTASAGNYETAIVLRDEAAGVLDSLGTENLEGSLPPRGPEWGGAAGDPPPVLLTSARQDVTGLTIHLSVSEETRCRIIAEVPGRAIELDERSLHPRDGTTTLEFPSPDQQVSAVTVAWQEGQVRAPVFQQGPGGIYEQAASGSHGDVLDAVMDRLKSKRDVVQMLAGFFGAEPPTDNGGDNGPPESPDGGNGEGLDIGPSRMPSGRRRRGFWEVLEDILRGRSPTDYPGRGDEPDGESRQPEGGSGTGEATAGEGPDEREVMILLADRFLDNEVAAKLAEGEAAWVPRYLKIVLRSTGMCAPASVLAPVSHHGLRRLGKALPRGEDWADADRQLRIETACWLTAAGAVMDPYQDRLDRTLELLLPPPMLKLVAPALGSWDPSLDPHILDDELSGEAWLTHSVSTRVLHRWHAHLRAYVLLREHGPAEAAREGIRELIESESDRRTLAVFRVLQALFLLDPTARRDSEADLQAASTQVSAGFKAEQLEELIHGE